MAPKHRLKVDLIEDDAAVRDSLGLYLESKGLDVRTFASGASYLKSDVNTAAAVDCIVTDVRMPGLSGLDLLRTLGRRGDPTQVIMITAFADVDMAVQAMKAGAFDFLEKPVDEQRLVASIRKAAGRSETLQARAAERADFASRLEHLTERERQVMLLAARGRTNRDIAVELGISPRTVEIHRASVMHKAGADSLADLVRIALVLGLTEADADVKNHDRNRT